MLYVALVATATWLLVLTVVCLLTIRQIALLTIRLEVRGEAFSFGDDGLEVGFRVPDDVLESLPELGERLGYVMLISSSCATCKELVPELAHDYRDPMVALVAGTPRTADAIIELLPTGFRAVRDPEATELARLLEVQSTPFVLEIESGIVTGKAYLHEPEDLSRLIGARSTSDAAEIALMANAVNGRGA